MEEKTFKSELFGLSKKEVEAYVNEQKSKYEDELAKIKKEKDEIEKKYNEILAREQEINEKTVLVSTALIKAEEQAKTIVSEAMEQAKKDRQEIDVAIELEREKLIDIKTDVINLKETVKNVLQNFIGELERIENSINTENS